MTLPLSSHSIPSHEEQQSEVELQFRGAEEERESEKVSSAC